MRLTRQLLMVIMLMMTITLIIIILMAIIFMVIINYDLHGQHQHAQGQVGRHLNGGGGDSLLLLFVFNQADLSLLNN